MYTLDLICSNGHPFEGWFANREAFERQRDDGLIQCMHCEDTSIQQVLSPVRIKKHASESPSPAPDTAAVTKAKGQILDHIEKNFEDVGQKFADEAIKIHVGDADKRNIRGTATSDEEKMLSEEGVSFFKLPNFQ